MKDYSVKSSRRIHRDYGLLVMDYSVKAGGGSTVKFYSIKAGGGSIVIMDYS